MTRKDVDIQPHEVADSVTRCVATGVAGLSVEVAVERIRAARLAIDHAGGGVLLTARAECYHTGHPDAFRESVRRLQAYSEAGADVLFAPGPSRAEEIKALVEAVQPKPFNLLVVRDTGLSVGDIAALGVRRITVGGALVLAAWAGFMHAAQILKSDGSFARLAGLAPYSEVNDFLAADLRARQG